MVNEVPSKELFILSIPNANSANLRSLADHLRPFMKENNIILTTTDVRPVSSSDLKTFLENMIKVIDAMPVKPVIKEPEKILDSKEQERVDAEVTDLLKKEGRL